MPKYNNPRRTWKYSNEFKVNAVEYVDMFTKSIETTWYNWIKNNNIIILLVSGENNEGFSMKYISEK